MSILMGRIKWRKCHDNKIMVFEHLHFRKNVHFFFQASWVASPFLSSLVWKGTPFAKNLDVKWKQITYDHTIQITVNQIMQASLSNFKIISVTNEFTNYCEKKNNKNEIHFQLKLMFLSNKEIYKCLCTICFVLCGYILP